jgi:hypothetical protein
MKTIEYRVLYSGAVEHTRGSFISYGAGADEEIVRVQARDINSGFTKALRRANEPLGNGRRREIVAIEFSQVVS